MADHNSVLPQSRPFLLESALTTSLHFAGNEIQSQMWKHAPEALALEYTQTMMGFALFNLAPQRIAMVGLGGGSLAKFCHRHLPDSNIVVVEINAQVVALRDAFQVPPDDARFQVQLGDGADLVGRARAEFDVLLVDGYDQGGLPPKLCSAGFYQHCRRALRDGGVLVANIVCAHPHYHMLIGRIRSAFDDAVLIVRDAEGRNDIVFAWVGALDDRYLGDHGRPLSIRGEAWDHLIPAVDRVRFAWRDRVRPKTRSR
jgi:spermidine synthase